MHRLGIHRCTGYFSSSISLDLQHGSGDAKTVCNRLIFSRIEPNLCLKDNLLPVYNMASSGLWKMFSYIIL